MKAEPQATTACGCAAVRLQDLLSAQLGVTRILAEAESLRTAAPQILRELCTRLGWEWGAFWRVQASHSLLVCRETFRMDGFEAPRFEDASRQARVPFPRDAIGRALAGRTGISVSDFQGESPDFEARYLAGLGEGVRSVALFPVGGGTAPIGMIELACRCPCLVDESVGEIMVSVCGQIGQFVERKRAHDEAARRRREIERQRAFMERMMSLVPGGIAYLDRSLIVRWANPQFGRMLRRSFKAVLDRPARESFADGRIRRLLQRVLQRGGSQRLSGHAPGQGQAEGTYWDVLVSAVGGAQGRGDGILVFLVDASERARADRFREQQVREYSKIDLLKTDFLNATSHELRTPLSIILGYAEFLEDQLGGPLTQRQSEFVEAIAQAAGALRLLVDDMLDFARLESGRFALEKRVVDVRGIVLGVVQHLESLAHHHCVDVRLEMPEEPVRIEMDPFRVSRVVRNLVTNAIKFNKAGGEVVVALSTTGRSVRVEVRDTGIGISERDGKRIFEKFYQVDGGATRMRGGAGLGLSVARGLVQAHRGKIGFSSTFGAGSVFWFTLPRGVRPQERDSE